MRGTLSAIVFVGAACCFSVVGCVPSLSRSQPSASVAPAPNRPHRVAGEQSVAFLSPELEEHILKQRTFLATASEEEKTNYFRALLPTEKEFKMLFGATRDAWISWKRDPSVAELVELYGEGGKSAEIVVRPLERDPSWYHGRIAALMRDRVAFRADVQAELNLKPRMYATYAFVNERWVFLRPPIETLEILERTQKNE
jgi:hypothetical protein